MKTKCVLGVFLNVSPPLKMCCDLHFKPKMRLLRTLKQG